MAAESRYHSNCLLRFNQNKEPQKKNKPKRGRKPSDYLMECFSKACDWLEGETLPCSVIDFRNKMTEFANGEDVYGVQYIKTLLTDRYKDHIAFSCDAGRENVIYFKKMADYLINMKYKEKGHTTEEEAERVMSLAAHLVKAEVREVVYNNDFYPSQDDIQDLNWSPKLLKQLIKGLTKSITKQEFIAQCIVKATKRDVIPPLLFGVGVDTDQSMGSRLLVSYLSKLGASITEDEIRLYRQSLLKFESESLFQSYQKTSLSNGAVIT